MKSIFDENRPYLKKQHQNMHHFYESEKQLLREIEECIRESEKFSLPVVTRSSLFSASQDLLSHSIAQEATLLSKLREQLQICHTGLTSSHDALFQEQIEDLAQALRHLQKQAPYFCFNEEGFIKTCSNLIDKIKSHAQKPKDTPGHTLYLFLPYKILTAKDEPVDAWNRAIEMLLSYQRLLYSRPLYRDFSLAMNCLNQQAGIVELCMQDHQFLQLRTNGTEERIQLLELSHSNLIRFYIDQRTFAIENGKIIDQDHSRQLGNLS